VARAERAVIAGSWEAAADNYARAAAYAEGLLDPPANDGGYTRVVFDYGASRLLAGDLAERGRVCDRLLEAEPPSAEKGPPSDNLFAAVRLSILAPRNAVAWPVVERACHWDCWWINDVATLIDYRGAKFQEAFEHWRTTGLDRFSMAMAYHQLGRVAEARASYARGAQWHERSMNIARIRGDFDDARDLLCGEVLRREAERLIFK